LRNPDCTTNRIRFLRHIAYMFDSGNAFDISGSYSNYMWEELAKPVMLIVEGKPLIIGGLGQRTTAVKMSVLARLLLLV
jgi:hypothetical protein